MKAKIFRISGILVLLLTLATTVLADDGVIFRKNVSKTPEYETEHAALKMLPVYVPAQASDGTLLTAGIEYYNSDGVLVETRYEARPLISFYTDGPVEYIDDPLYGGFPGHGERDAFAGVSLDDGATWSRTNLSNSADLSSFKIKLGGRQKVPYPGDVGRTFIASDGNQVLAVWVSRFADGGSPNYAITAEERSAVAEHLAATGMIDDASVCTDDYDDTGRITADPADSPCLYLEDHFGVAGSQGSSDLADEGLPLVGELPYAAVWVARGVLLPPEATGLDTSTFVWFKAERLSSAVRDANRPEVACAKGAGCTITWQEDPDGIRPGEGEGPGEGWSGAIAHHQTDTWYSYISWNDFALVGGDSDGDNKVDYGTVYDETLSGFTSLTTWLVDNPESGRPQAAIPMSIPVRLTDNAMCVELDEDGNYDNPYCYMDFDNSGTADFCASTVTVTIEVPDTETGVATDHDVEMCIAEDGRLMRGNTASTRARINLNEYSSEVEYNFEDRTANLEFFNTIDSAWFTMSYEENKGLGECEDDETLADPNICDTADFVDKIDMGKNVWYHTFDIFNPELVSQGLMLNQPAVYPDGWTDESGLLTADDQSLGYNFYQITDDPIYDTQAELGTTTLYQTEISRRPSPIVQDWYNAGDTGTVAFQLWKQGIIRRGGPADIMGRAFIIPDGFDSTLNNPYDYANMECLNLDGSDGWAFKDGSNPRYVKGLCAAPADNISANTIVDGDIADGSAVEIGIVECSDVSCLVSSFPFSLYFDDVAGGEPIPSIFEWAQAGPGLGESITDTTLTNFDDPTWENPYDVAKGHRGFLQGDMLMVMYAWSPNWKANTVGHDNYNLYNRRSFDGGQTWSTLPGSFTHTNGTTYNGDGTTTCEWYYTDSESTSDQSLTDVTGNEFAVCTEYAAGAFEQARNVSQLLGTHETILDPRYTPATPSITDASVSTPSLPVGFTAPYDDASIDINDVQDSSRYFMVYETGDNTTTAFGEAEPLDLFYSRAVNWGDDYLVWAEETDLSTCLPDESTIETDVLDGTGFCNEFDPLEGSQFSESGEASVTTNPDTTFFYAIWNQVDFGVDGLNEDSDAWFRRVLFLDDYVPTVDDGTGPGNTAPGQPTVTNPADGAVFPADTLIEFSATASDPEDGDLTNSIVWTLNQDVIGTGANFTAVLPAGTHTVIASVTDSGGLSASSSVTFTVEEPTPTPEPEELGMTVVGTATPDVVFKGDTVEIIVTVTDENGAAVEGAYVVVKIVFTNITIEKLAFTDANGSTVITYKINSIKTGTGPANVIATVTKDGYVSETDQLLDTFSVQ